jgi:hypothetical protein
MVFRYSRRVIFLYIISTLLLGSLMLMTYHKTGPSRAFMTLGYVAVLFIVFALRMVREPYCELHDRLLIIRPPITLGAMKRLNYKFQPTDEFELVKDRLYLLRSGKRERIPLSARYIEPQDWETLLMQLSVLR